MAKTNIRGRTIIDTHVLQATLTTNRRAQSFTRIKEHGPCEAIAHTDVEVRGAGSAMCACDGGGLERRRGGVQGAGATVDGHHWSRRWAEAFAADGVFVRQEGKFRYCCFKVAV